MFDGKNIAVPPLVYLLKVEFYMECTDNVMINRHDVENEI